KSDHPVVVCGKLTRLRYSLRAGGLVRRSRGSSAVEPCPCWKHLLAVLSEEGLCRSRIAAALARFQETPQRCASMHYFNTAYESAATRPVVPPRHPLRWLFLMAGLGIGLPLLGFGMLEAISLLGGWSWEFLGHPTGSSWALLALLLPLPFASLLL